MTRQEPDVRASPWRGTGNRSGPKEQLIRAASLLDLETTRELVLAGADVKYVEQATSLPTIHGVRLYTADGSEIPDMDEDQPYTALRMCVFKFSDCDLDDDDRRRIMDIAKLLLQHGAPEPDDPVNPCLWTAFHALLR